MDPDMGYQCCSVVHDLAEVIEKRKETNSVFLQNLPEAKWRKVFGERDLKMVLISRAYK